MPDPVMLGRCKSTPVRSQPPPPPPLVEEEAQKRTRGCGGCPQPHGGIWRGSQPKTKEGNVSRAWKSLGWLSEVFGLWLKLAINVVVREMPPSDADAAADTTAAATAINVDADAAPTATSTNAPMTMEASKSKRCQICPSKEDHKTHTTCGGYKNVSAKAVHFHTAMHVQLLIWGQIDAGW